MKRLLSLIISLVCVVTSVNYAYIPGSISEDNIVEEGYEFFTTDSAAYVSQMAERYEYDNPLRGLSEEELLKIDKALGLEAGSTMTARESKKISGAMGVGVIAPFLSKALLHSQAPYNYNDFMYQVRYDDSLYKDWEQDYVYVSGMSSRQYRVIYEVCKKFKWDYLALLAKWCYQSAHYYGIEQTKNHFNWGLSGQIMSEDGGVALLEMIFNPEELKEVDKPYERDETLKSCVINNTKRDGYPNGRIKARGNGTYWLKDFWEDVRNKQLEHDKETLKRIIFLYRDAKDDRINLMKENVILMKEIRLFLSSIANGVERTYKYKEPEKLREIMQKEQWSDEDMDYLFGDLVEEDKVIAEYDNLPKWKQQAYLILKHWSNGSSDSSASGFCTYSKISDIILNDEFDLQAAKRDIQFRYEQSILATRANHGDVDGYVQQLRNYQTVQDTYYGYIVSGTPFYTTVIYGLNIDKIEENKNIENFNTDFVDYTTSEFEEEINREGIMKAMMFVLQGYRNGRIGIQELDAHGTGHAGFTQQKIFQQRVVGCGLANKEVDPPVQVGSSAIAYNATLEWWYSGGTITRTDRFN